MKPSIVRGAKKTHQTVHADENYSVFQEKQTLQGLIGKHSADWTNFLKTSPSLPVNLVYLKLADKLVQYLAFKLIAVMNAADQMGLSLETGDQVPHPPRAGTDFGSEVPRDSDNRPPELTPTDQRSRQEFSNEKVGSDAPREASDLSTDTMRKKKQKQHQQWLEAIKKLFKTLNSIEKCASQNEPKFSLALYPLMKFLKQRYNFSTGGPSLMKRYVVGDSHSNSNRRGRRSSTFDGRSCSFSLNESISMAGNSGTAGPKGQERSSSLEPGNINEQASISSLIEECGVKAQENQKKRKELFSFEEQENEEDSEPETKGIKRRSLRNQLQQELTMENIPKDQQQQPEEKQEVKIENVFADGIKGNSKIHAAVTKDDKFSPKRNTGLTNSDNHGHCHSCNQQTFGCSGGCNPQSQQINITIKLQQDNVINQSSLVPSKPPPHKAPPPAQKKEDIVIRTNLTEGENYKEAMNREHEQLTDILANMNNEYVKDVGSKETFQPFNQKTSNTELSLYEKDNSRNPRLDKCKTSGESKSATKPSKSGETKDTQKFPSKFVQPRKHSRDSSPDRNSSHIATSLVRYANQNYITGKLTHLSAKNSRHQSLPRTGTKPSSPTDQSGARHKYSSNLLANKTRMRNNRSYTTQTLDDAKKNKPNRQTSHRKQEISSSKTKNRILSPSHPPNSERPQGSQQSQRRASQPCMTQRSEKTELSENNKQSKDRLFAYEQPNLIYSNDFEKSERAKKTLPDMPQTRALDHEEHGKDASLKKVRPLEPTDETFSGFDNRSFEKEGERRQSHKQNFWPTTGSQEQAVLAIDQGNNPRGIKRVMTSGEARRPNRSLVSRQPHQAESMERRKQSQKRPESDAMRKYLNQETQQPRQQPIWIREHKDIEGKQQQQQQQQKKPYFYRTKRSEPAGTTGKFQSNQFYQNDLSSIQSFTKIDHQDTQKSFGSMAGFAPPAGGNTSSKMGTRLIDDLGALSPSSNQMLFMPKINDQAKLSMAYQTLTCNKSQKVGLNKDINAWGSTVEADSAAPNNSIFPMHTIANQRSSQFTAQPRGVGFKRGNVHEKIQNYQAQRQTQNSRASHQFINQQSSQTLNSMGAQSKTIVSRRMQRTQQVYKVSHPTKDQQLGSSICKDRSSGNLRSSVDKVKGQARSNQLLRDSHHMMEELDKDDALNYVESAEPHPKVGMIDENSISDNYHPFLHEGASVEVASLPNQTHDHSLDIPVKSDEEDCYGSKQKAVQMFHPVPQPQSASFDVEPTSPKEKSSMGIRKKDNSKMTIQHKPMVFGSAVPKSSEPRAQTKEGSRLKKAKVEIKPSIRAASKGSSFRKRPEVKPPIRDTVSQTSQTQTALGVGAIGHTYDKMVSDLMSIKSQYRE